MSCRVSTTSLIPGACVVGHRGLGVLGATIRANTATGEFGAGYLFNDLSPADDAKEVRGLIVTPPASGTFFAYEDGSVSLTGVSNGAYGFTYRLYVDGVDLGTATASVSIGGAVDSTAPVLTGTLTPSSIGSTSYTLSWPAGTDNVGVAGYDLSLDGGSTWSALGNVTTTPVSSRTPASTDQVRVRARDAAGNTSAALSATVTLLASGGADTTAPVWNSGSLIIGTPSSTGYSLSWPTANDGVGVAGYEVSVNGGTTFAPVGLVTTVAISGRTPSTIDTVQVRAYDAAGNRSIVLQGTAQLAAVPLIGGEPVTLQQAKLAARLDADDTALDGEVADAITEARRMAEHITGRLYRDTTVRHDLADWPAGPVLLPVHGPRAVVISYWDGTAWQTLDSQAFVWTATDTSTAIAPALGASWPALGPVALGPRVRIDIIAGPTSTDQVPEEVKRYIKVMVSHTINHPDAAQRGAMQSNPLHDRLLDREKLWR